MVVHKLADQFGLVSGMPIHDQKDLPIHAGDQPLEKLVKDPSRPPSFHGHESKMAQGIDRRKHVEGEPGAGGLHQRGLALGSPGGPPYDSPIELPTRRQRRSTPVRAWFASPAADRPCGARRPRVSHPVATPDTPAVVASTPGASSTAPPTPHSSGRQTPDKSLHESGPRPQGKLKLQLQGILGPHQRRQLRQLLGREFRPRPANRFGVEGGLAPRLISREPAIDRPTVEPEAMGQGLGTPAGSHAFHRSKSLCLNGVQYTLTLTKGKQF